MRNEGHGSFIPKVMTYWVTGASPGEREVVRQVAHTEGFRETSYVRVDTPRELGSQSRNEILGISKQWYFRFALDSP